MDFLQPPEPSYARSLSTTVCSEDDLSFSTNPNPKGVSTQSSSVSGREDEVGLILEAQIDKQNFGKELSESTPDAATTDPANLEVHNAPQGELIADAIDSHVQELRDPSAAFHVLKKAQSLPSNIRNWLATSQPGNGKVVHSNIYCDGLLCASKPSRPDIEGTRYKCTICEDIDFCAYCETDPRNNHDRSHPLIKFEVPNTEAAADHLTAKPCNSPVSYHSDIEDLDSDGSENDLFERVLKRRRASHERRGSSISATPDSLKLSTETDYMKKIRELRRACSEHEEKLLSRIVDPAAIPEGYSHVHVDPQVIENLECSTSLAFERPGAFEQGILRNYKITGALLYGPPGTGKTLLAQAVAKVSNFNMLMISSGDVFQQYVGEEEKVIRAAFSLARKLHPCIMFVDEADGLLSARRSDDKKYLTSMIGEFLREWDGISEDKLRNPFVLLATNRPFDLDPAVIRRAPVHIFMNVPTPAQRQGILGVLLQDEVLEGLTLELLARITHSFTGSDLKNLCVAAALVCLQEQTKDPCTGQFPATRVLMKRHFDVALKNIRATIPNMQISKQLEAFHRRTG